MIVLHFAAEHELRPASVVTEVVDQRGRRRWLGLANLAHVNEIPLDKGAYLVRAHLPSGNVAEQQVEGEPDQTTVLHIGSADADWACEDPATQLAIPRMTQWVREGNIWSTRPIAAISTARGFRMESNRRDHVTGAIGWLRLGGGDGIVAVPVDAPGELAMDKALGTVILRSRFAAIDAMLEYMVAGQHFWAALIANAEFNRLWQSRRSFDASSDPLASIALGYFGLRASYRDWGSLKAKDAAATWCETLMSALPESPDAAVITGWQALKAGDDDLAAGAFIEACARGVPVYSFGLRYLVDGLQMFADRTAESAAAYEWIGAQADAVDWDRRLTTIARSAPAAPMSVPVITVAWRPLFGRPAKDILVDLRTVSADYTSSLKSAVAAVIADPFAQPRFASGVRFAPMRVRDRELRLLYSIDQANGELTIFDVEGAEELAYA